ncbi:MAG: GNAT family N-acetyltransferase [Bacteroidetes bacterium]|nr:GNAT family N-acetyltransferase [Bacteroidota bacterium]
MNPKTIDPNEVKVLAASQLPKEQFEALLRALYPRRFPFLTEHWEWYYRTSFFDRRVPLILMVKDQAAGIAGMLPVRIQTETSTPTASWFIDFALLPAFQRKGLGTVLTKKWMSFADMQITFCNDMSIGVFKKLGWTESFDNYLHTFLLRPFETPQLAERLPGIVRKPMNFFMGPLFKWRYSKSSLLKVRPLSEKNPEEFFPLTEKENKTEGYEVYRDPAYLNWRLLQSPDLKNYQLVSMPGIEAIIACKENKGRYIDILWISDLSDSKAVKKLIQAIGHWGIINKYAYMRFFTTLEKLSKFLSKGMPQRLRNPRFAFFSKDPALYERMKNNRWNFQLIDSDFENFGSY